MLTSTQLLAVFVIAIALAELARPAVTTFTPPGIIRMKPSFAPAALPICGCSSDRLCDDVSQMKSRRQVLQAVAGAAVLPVLPLSAAQVYSPKALNACEMRLLSVLVDLIIPRTDTPGATDAGVPVWIDDALSSDAPVLARCRSGLTWLDAEARTRFHAPFIELSEHDQTALLTPLATEASQVVRESWCIGCPTTEANIASDGVRFFILLKDMALDAYYASREGLVVELGYQGNTHLAKFEGCTHPEHQS